jgi:hypothetical protein
MDSAAHPPLLRLLMQFGSFEWCWNAKSCATPTSRPRTGTTTAGPIAATRTVHSQQPKQQGRPAHSQQWDNPFAETRTVCSQQRDGPFPFPATGRYVRNNKIIIFLALHTKVNNSFCGTMMRASKLTTRPAQIHLPPPVTPEPCIAPRSIQ